MRRIKFPDYTSDLHNQLLGHFKADLKTLPGRGFHADLFDGTPTDLAVKMDAKIRNKFEMPVYAFNQRLDNIVSYQAELSDGEIIAQVISAITRYKKPGKTIGVCMALVTCGLRAGPSCFPEIYQDHVHDVMSYGDKLVDNLEAVSARAFISPHEVNANRQTMLSVTETEGDLGAFWRVISDDKNPPPDIIWSKAKHLSLTEKRKRWQRKLLRVVPKHEFR